MHSGGKHGCCTSLCYVGKGTLLRWLTIAQLTSGLKRLQVVFTKMARSQLPTKYASSKTRMRSSRRWGNHGARAIANGDLRSGPAGSACGAPFKTTITLSTHLTKLKPENRVTDFSMCVSSIRGNYRPALCSERKVHATKDNMQEQVFVLW